VGELGRALGPRMSRDDGFAVMDVSTGYVDDPKWRKLARYAPDQLGPAFIAYTATMAESWGAGRRVTIEDAWPALIPFSKLAVDALRHVGLLDSHGLVQSRAWRGWFGPAKARRDMFRDRWARANEKRRAEAALSPRGSDAVTASPVPSVPSVPVDTREIPPPPAERGRRAKGTDPRSNGLAPRDLAANPRAKGTSTRQVRATEKRGPTKLGDVLRKAAATKPEPVATPEEPDWMLTTPGGVKSSEAPAGLGPHGSHLSATSKPRPESGGPT